ncbi:LUC7 domain-containing protein [Aspergillus clavatus NRRL 1]|uniref:U1 snRNP splicing complex subunit (Luc7), putative n=1 Tax=Aspergillus clavatus (strain ATCC 1007 / CBS 513.65 / DSM 816 / NCTC 3887 / NRRL 1 / QM 1276 / 107) TaxID=344612 RepID=A1CTK8_ASPCL|nr:U1 snRNP splicing complex subunit (Luc7), putative [Aspergillus clavatus NRRL 1]EAW06645.1 U1 snRNP splicing complex subunit (Luc7), putative [Aspergillus clavatus NRRL 1]
MAAEQRKLLEQLMGADQLIGTGGPSRNAQLSITDSKVCRSYLVGTCPHDLFTNTKQDLGPCPKVHSEGLKTEYEAASAAEKAKWGFDFDYMRDMQKYVDDCDRRIDSAQRRLEKTPDEIRQTNNLLKQISDLTKTINTGLLEVSILGETGSVAQALNELHKIRTAKHQKETCERELKNLQDTSGPSGHQKLQVCDVCGAYLSRLDNDRRLADHFFGKMHMGYSDMRKTCKRLSEELKGRAPPVRHHDEEDGGWGGRPGGGRGPRYGGGGYRKRGGRW